MSDDERLRLAERVCEEAEKFLQNTACVGTIRSEWTRGLRDALDERYLFLSKKKPLDEVNVERGARAMVRSAGLRWERVQEATRERCRERVRAVLRELG